MPKVLFCPVYFFSSFFILFNSLFFAAISCLHSCFLFFCSSISFCFCSSANSFSFSKSGSVTSSFWIASGGGFSLEKQSSVFWWIFFFVLPFVKFQVESVSKVYSPFFNKSINFRVGGCINKLKDLFIINQFLFNFMKIFFVFFNLFSHNFSDVWINNIFTV